MKKIFLIAGHNLTSDSGAVSENGIREVDLTKKTRDRIAYYLNKFYPELEVVLDNDSHTLSQVIRWIKDTEGNNSLVYDFHWNAASNPTATGVEAFVSDNASKKSKEMASRVVDVITKISGMRDRGVKTESQSARKRLGILNTKSPATLVELGFISNPNDRESFDEWQEQIHITAAHEIAYQAKN